MAEDRPSSKILRRLWGMNSEAVSQIRICERWIQNLRDGMWCPGSLYSFQLEDQRGVAMSGG
jgi:hypothetical protein